MRIVIAPDKFKSSLSAEDVVAAIARGLRIAGLADVDLCPLADGGEGTVDALVAATGGSFHTARVTGPLPDMTVEARFGILGDKETAVIEMAAASGLALLRPDRRNPLKTTTYGTGELLMHARELGCRRIILGIGGSATTDGGVGCAQACGVRFEMDATGATAQVGRATPPDPSPATAGVGRPTLAAASRPLVGGDLPSIRHIDTSTSKLRDVQITAACDVDNPLFGPRGAAYVFAPQKGASPADVELLDQSLRHLATVSSSIQNPQSTIHNLPRTPGAGAAGGLGFGLLAFLGATLRPGIDIIIDAVNLRDRLKGAQLCITGEGKLDSQSLGGKTAIGVARVCREMNIPCIAIAGTIADDLDPAAARDQGLGAWFSICPGPVSLDFAMANAAKLIESLAGNVGKLVVGG